MVVVVVALVGLTPARVVVVEELEEGVVVGATDEVLLAEDVWDFVEEVAEEVLG